MAACRELYLDGRYGESGMRQWVEAALALGATHPSGWDVPVTVEEVLARITQNSHWELFRVFNELYAEAKSARIWLSKEPEAIHYCNEIAASLPDAKFIYLVRDGRDVAASMLKGSVHEQHIYGVAKRWSRDQARGMELLSDPATRDAIFLVRYEDFVGDPDGQMEKILEFIGCEPEQAAGPSHIADKAREQSRKSRLWMNLEKPVDARNYGKYRDSLSNSQLRTFETLAADALEFFGYKPEFGRGGTFPVGFEVLVKLQTAANVILSRARKDIRREHRIRREFNAVVRKIQKGEPFGR